ncbi:MAG: D-alanine--D-alanine ligase [Deltaproteobacteria bacterium]|nr:D-alanine--D-alanine ligase [Deltaproteobacteria bacterium]
MTQWHHKRVGVLFGGLSAEREISHLSGTAICKILQERGYTVTPLEVDASGTWIPRVRDTDVVFIALHGKFGEDGTVQGVLELLGVPYTGSGVLASALAMNKPMAKRVWQVYGLPTPAWQVIEQAHPTAVTLPYPVVVKPSTEGSSVGVTIVRSADMLAPALTEAWRFDPQALVETYVPGKEVTVGILGEQALGAMEVIAKGEFHSYDVKYTAGREEFILPAPLSPAVYDHVMRVALAAHRALECYGYSRVDTRITEQGDVFLLEVNSLPGFTGLSYLPRIAEYAGLNYGDLVEAILQRATLHVRRSTR